MHEKVMYCVGFDAEGKPILRPAVVVQQWPGYAYVNVVVFLDGENDASRTWPVPEGSKEAAAPMFTKEEIKRSSAWRTSVHPGSGVGQYR